MRKEEKFLVTNIRRYLDSDNPEMGEDNLFRVLDNFSCPKNSDVERFLKKSAIEFTKKNQSVTYLVSSVATGNLVGYFTIALKPLTIQGENISNTAKRKIMRVSEFDEQTKSYTMSAYLIAQLGKNYSADANKEISGIELLELAWSIIEKAKYMLGGMVTFLETENQEKLLTFYTNNNFRQFHTRKTANNTTEPHELVQLLRLL